MRYHVDDNEGNEVLESTGLDWCILDRHENDACVCECYMKTEAEFICRMLNAHHEASPAERKMGDG